jgi:hypothetical protein
MPQPAKREAGGPAGRESASRPDPADLLSATTPAERILALQRTAGNAKVGRLLRSREGPLERALDAPKRAVELLDEGLVLGARALAAVAEEGATDRAHRRLLKRLGMSANELERAVAELRARERFKQAGLGGRLPGEVDIKHYPLFAYRAGAADAVVPYLLPLVYAVPIVGEAIAVTEAVAGRSFFTGEKLKSWERALTLTLAAIPHARGLWQGVSAAVRVSRNIDAAVIWLAVRSGRSVKDVMRTLARVSRLRPSAIRRAVAETREAAQVGNGGSSFSAAHRETADAIARALDAERRMRVLPAAGGYSGKTIAELKVLAKSDPEAVWELRARYQNMTNDELRVAARRDALARQVAAERRAVTLTAVPDDPRWPGHQLPHEATAVSRDARGNVVWRGAATSGNMTEAERAMPFPQGMNASHTEGRLLVAGQLPRGGTLRITGQYDPCAACQTAMRATAERTGCTIEYWWPGAPKGRPFVARPKATRPPSTPSPTAPAAAESKTAPPQEAAPPVRTPRRR